MQGEINQMPLSTSYVAKEEEDAVPVGEAISTPRSSQNCTDPLNEELIKQALDSSKSEIAMMKELTQEQKVKIGKLRAKNADLRATNLGKDEELAQKRVQSEK